MKNSILKSIWACLAGMLVGAILAVLTDTILEKTGLMTTQPFDANPVWLIIIVIIYRNVYNILGSFVTARLAPFRPMKHVMIVAAIGLVATIVGTIVMWHVPPHWYPISLIILTPCLQRKLSI